MKRVFKFFVYLLLIVIILFNMVSASYAYRFSHYYNSNEIDSTEVKKGKLHRIKTILFGPKLVKSSIVDKPYIPYQNIRLVTDDNVHLAGWYSVHSDTSSKGTILMFHGASSCRSSLVAEMKEFYNAGYNVLTIDFRGNGESEGNTTTISYIEVHDAKAAYDYVAKTGEKNISMYGKSMGAATAIRTIAVYQTPVKALICDASFGSVHQAIQGRIRDIHFPPEPLATLMSFWGSIIRNYWIFGTRPSEYVKKVYCPTLIQRGANDDRVTHEETMEIYNNLASPVKKVVEYSNCGHESLYAKHPDEWRKNILEILDSASK